MTPQLTATKKLKAIPPALIAPAALVLGLLGMWQLAHNIPAPANEECQAIMDSEVGKLSPLIVNISRKAELCREAGYFAAHLPSVQSAFTLSGAALTVGGTTYSLRGAAIKRSNFVSSQLRVPIPAVTVIVGQQESRLLFASAADADRAFDQLGRVVAGN